LETSISELAPLIINALMTIAIINQLMEKLLAKKKFFMIPKKVLAIFIHKIITTKKSLDMNTSANFIDLPKIRHNGTLK
jgi:hypothetical protein